MAFKNANQPTKEKNMNITKTTIITAALFAVASLCQAASLRTVSSDYEKTDTTLEETSGDESSDSTVDLGDESTLSFSIDGDFPETIDGYEVLSEFLPEGVALEWNGKKLKAPKAGKVKYSKKDEGFVDTKDSENPSGLSAKYNKKRGTISGSFKVYVAKSEKKLKTYSAKYSGKIGGSLKVTVKGKSVATASVA